MPEPEDQITAGHAREQRFLHRPVNLKYMPRIQVLLALAFAALAGAADFSGTSALEFTKRVVAFGSRPPGSRANAALRAYIHQQIKLRGGEASEDAFTAQTPNGRVPMVNVIAKFPGKSGRRATVFTGHFDTKYFPGRKFVGANDGGSSTGLLLELMRTVSASPHGDDVYFVWFDGEEAFGEWSDTDGIYGSRHLAEKWATDGMLQRIRALINVDMIGDSDLKILQEGNSTAQLRRDVWRAAEDRGYGKYFADSGGTITDDHVPFLRRGVPALDLIDFEYGPNNAYWHTDKDTIDKISAHSFQVVGDVLMEILRRISAP